MNITSYEDFIKVSKEFSLGTLTTESFHPLTKNLSHYAKSDISKAISLLKQVDLMAFKNLTIDREILFSIYSLVKDVRKNKGRIFLCGCGATGRLSLSLETIARQYGLKDIIGFMAGGDFALIKSVESFEDKMEYGSKQLIELGFKEGDILFAITEGGETSFVIGAALMAAKISSRQTQFLYCNPDSDLMHLKRFQDILESNAINKVNLTVGAMALSGSTRMQASTVQMFIAGLVILYDYKNIEEFNYKFDEILSELKSLDYSKLEQLIIEEAKIYLNNEITTYRSPKDFGICVLTDTTERSPTFSLEPFEQLGSSKNCLCYLVLENEKDSKDAWFSLLGREPRGLNWNELSLSIDKKEIFKFDISEKSIERRNQIKKNHLFNISFHQNELKMNLNNHQSIFKLGEGRLLQHLSLKMLLNTHSTLIMGRLERYESNMMTWVKPSNLKLIDRASRYAYQLLRDLDQKVEFDQVLKCIISHSLDSDLHLTPIVLKVVQKLKNT